MKNVKLCIGIIIGLVLSGITVYALSINSKDVSYKTTNVSDAIDDLYEKVANTGTKFCELKSGNALEVGSMYECDPGDGVKRNFYVLTIRENSLDLILDRNINSGMVAWATAMKYFRSGEGLNIKNSWTNVLNIDLPKVQSIADAVGYDTWIGAEAGKSWWCLGSHVLDSQTAPYCTNANQGKYAWLFNHLTNCTQGGCTDNSGASAYGYWTMDMIGVEDRAYLVYGLGYIDYRVKSVANDNGVRPVITVLKGNLK